MTKQQTEALKPCPFCGGGASFEHLESGRWSIGCADIDGDCMGFQSLQTFPRKADAIAAWNARATPSPSQTDAQALLRNVVSHATGGHIDIDEHPGIGLNAICVEISRHHNRVFAGGKESALNTGGSHD